MSEYENLKKEKAKREEELKVREEERRQRQEEQVHNDCEKHYFEAFEF